MKRLMVVFAAAALVAGCKKVSEAEKFGYKGVDLADEEPMFFTTAPTVTNWVPARVLAVFEEYPMSAEESALVAAAGVVSPGEPLEKIPEGYEKSADEPWFVTWTKDAENFGRKGKNGFVSHYNEEKKVWETSETYFSSYYSDEASALAALADIRQTVAAQFAPKKFYDFDKCWVAEYLRLRVMCLVGQKPDGTWSCMLDVNDKNRLGCGQWEPVPAQEERVAEVKYRKALAAWKEARKKALADNHAAVEKARAERGLALFGEASRQFETEDGRTAYVTGGTFAFAADGDRKAVWEERQKEIAKATGVVFEGEPVVQEIPSGYVVWGASATNDIYDVRVDIAFPPPQLAEPPKELAEGETSPGPPPGEWRALCFEKALPGFEVPPRPQPPKH